MHLRVPEHEHEDQSAFEMMELSVVIAFHDSVSITTNCLSLLFAKCLMMFNQWKSFLWMTKAMRAQRQFRYLWTCWHLSLVSMCDGWETRNRWAIFGLYLQLPDMHVVASCFFSTTMCWCSQECWEFCWQQLTLMFELVQWLQFCWMTETTMILLDGCGLVLADGSDWSYGRGLTASEAADRYVREVDYVTAACVLIRRHLLFCTCDCLTSVSPSDIQRGYRWCPSRSERVNFVSFDSVVCSYDPLWEYFSWRWRGFERSANEETEDDGDRAETVLGRNVSQCCDIIWTSDKCRSTWMLLLLSHDSTQCDCSSFCHLFLNFPVETTTSTACEARMDLVANVDSSATSSCCCVHPHHDCLWEWKKWFVINDIKVKFAIETGSRSSSLHWSRCDFSWTTWDTQFTSPWRLPTRCCVIGDGSG